MAGQALPRGLVVRVAGEQVDHATDVVGLGCEVGLLGLVFRVEATEVFSLSVNSNTSFKLSSWLEYPFWEPLYSRLLLRQFMSSSHE